MPTNRMRNLVYRTALPLLSPSLHRQLDHETCGVAPGTLPAYTRILEKHHVLGSSLYLESGNKSMEILTSVRKPVRQVNSSTLFRIASLTKTVTTLAVLRLCRQGLMRLDAPVSLYLPEQHPQLRDVTVEQILAHRSGLQDLPAYEQALRGHDSYIRVLDTSGVRIAAPGSTFHYCNFAFGLLGCVMEQVTGLSVAKAMQELVLDPLHMRGSLDVSLLDRKELLPCTRILPWHGDASGFLPGPAEPMTVSPHTHFGYTAGALYTDARSLAALMRCIRHRGMSDYGLFLDECQVDAMMTQHSTYGKQSPTLSYGLGLLIIRDPRLSAGTIYGHQGFAYGSVHGAFFSEADDRILIFLSGGCSEARNGMLGLCNRDLLAWSHEEVSAWKF